jgi:hypothetical protein
LIAGGIAAAATAGVLMGLGRSRSSVWSLLNDAAHTIVGGRARIAEHFDPVATPVGVATHIVALVFWGMVFSLIAASLRGKRLAGAALVYAGAVFAIDRWLLPVELRPGYESVMSSAELLILYLALAIGLALGMREAMRAETLA